MKVREKPRIVVVDDERDFLQVMRLSLGSKYDVDCFSDGQGLLDHLAALEPDLLILDLYMPGMSGRGLCREVRSDARFAGIPILFLTSSRSDEDFLRSLDAGADMYLTKPISARDLDARIREMLPAR